MLTALLVALAAAPSPAPSPAEKAAERAITADVLRAHTRFLASDLLEGRGPSTRGDQLGQEYIAAQFEALGLRPAAPGGGWYQRFDVVGVTGHPQKLSLAAGTRRLELSFHDDFIAVSGKQAASSKLAGAEVVFVGYGIVAPEYRWDDYKNADLAGKVLLMMNNDPEDDPALFAGKTRLWYGRWDYKYEMAAKQGAAGAIIIHTAPSAGYPWQVVQTSWSGEQFELPRSGAPALEVKAWVTEEAARRLVALGGQDLDALRASAQKRDFTPVPLGVTASTEFASEVHPRFTGNVLGLWPGSDPRLAGEQVVFSAHHDHLGLKAGVSPGEDAIYNGAMDNASGVAGMLAVAKALASMPRAPRRSIVFAATAAEEQGLLGARYLVAHPTAPLGRIAADVNIEGSNIWGRTRDVTLVGLGKSSVDAFVLPLAAAQGRAVKPDPMPERGMFYRQDGFQFARQGVPVAYLGSGLDYRDRPDGWGRKQRDEWVETHYHRPNDELVDTWDLSGAVEDTRLYFELGVALANAPAMPEWTKGDEFEAARKRSLEALKATPSTAARP